MVKVVNRSAKFARLKGPAMEALVGSKRVRGEDGKLITIRTLETRSVGFSEGLTYVFGLNAAKARRENKLATGFSDFVPVKR